MILAPFFHVVPIGLVTLTPFFLPPHLKETREPTLLFLRSKERGPPSFLSSASTGRLSPFPTSSQGNQSRVEAAEEEDREMTLRTYLLLL